MEDIFESIRKTLVHDQQVSTQKEDNGLTLKRDEHGVLRSYDADGKPVGRIYEHGDK